MADIRQKVMAAVAKADLRYPGNAVDSTMSYLAGLNSTKELFAISSHDIERMVGMQKDLDGGKGKSASLKTILGTESPTPIDVREVLGAGGMQQINDIVRTGSRSDEVVTQFSSDFQNYGLGDAMFLLGASTADGLFDRIAYNSLVDILDSVRLQARS